MSVADAIRWRHDVGGPYCESTPASREVASRKPNTVPAGLSFLFGSLRIGGFQRFLEIRIAYISPAQLASTNRQRHVIHIPIFLRSDPTRHLCQVQSVTPAHRREATHRPASSQRLRRVLRQRTMSMERKNSGRADTGEIAMELGLQGKHAIV